MASVSIFHNLSRDMSFGLNAVFRTAATRPEGIERVHEMSDGRFMWKDQATKDERHELVWVFQYHCVGSTDEQILNDAFEMFNVGDDGIAKEYRERKLRSLSVGDVVVIDQRAYSCESVGWKERKVSELGFVPASKAEQIIRERYELGPREPLSISVPLAD